MLKVLRNLRKSLGSVIIIVILLCIQAMTDLALPDYTSKIVNIGIQAGGIETAIPEVITKEDMDAILILTKGDNEILENYTLMGNNPNREEEKKIKKYLGKDKKIEKDTIYVLKQIEEETKNNLTKLMINPLMELTVLEKEETAYQIKEQMTKNMREEQKQFIQSQDLIGLIKSMPEEERDKLLEEFTNKINEMQDSIKEQAAVSCVKEIYKKAGVDLDKLQNDYILKSGLQMLGVASITMISAISIMLLSSRVAAKLGRKTIFE